MPTFCFNFLLVRSGQTSSQLRFAPFMANIIIPNTNGTQSKSGWVETRNAALALWAEQRIEVKKYARIFDVSRATIRHILEEVDEFVRDYLFEPENLKSELKYKPCFFDFELDSSYHNPDIVRELPDQCEATDPKINVASSFVPRGALTPSNPLKNSSKPTPKTEAF